MDCKSLQEKIAADCKRTEDHVMSTWLPKIIQLFRSKETLNRVKEKKLDSFFKSASTLISNQVRKFTIGGEFQILPLNINDNSAYCLISKVEIPASEKCRGVCNPV